jgi:hypothetical protein
MTTGRIDVTEEPRYQVWAALMQRTFRRVRLLNRVSGSRK